MLRGICDRFGMRRKIISAAAVERLCACDWKRNNVRELRNVIERALLAARGAPEIRVEGDLTRTIKVGEESLLTVIVKDDGIPRAGAVGDGGGGAAVRRPGGTTAVPTNEQLRAQRASICDNRTPFFCGEPNEGAGNLSSVKGLRMQCFLYRGDLAAFCEELRAKGATFPDHICFAMRSDSSSRSLARWSRERTVREQARGQLEWIPLLRPFTAQHPRAARAWVAERAHDPERIIGPRRFRPAHLRFYVSDWIERLTGARLFEFRNYVVV